MEEEGGGNRGSWLLACFGRGAVSDCEGLVYGVTGLLLLLLLPPTVVRGSCCCADVKWRRRRRRRREQQSEKEQRRGAERSVGVASL